MKAMKTCPGGRQRREVILYSYSGPLVRSNAALVNCDANSGPKLSPLISFQLYSYE
jgi:hypothetical protein